MRQASPLPVTERSEEIDCVATIGMQRDCRLSPNAFSSPLGSASPTVANDWYSSHRKMAGRKNLLGILRMSAGRCNSAPSQLCLSITPIARGEGGVG